MGHLVINMLDDFHVIQTITVPGEMLTLSSSTHMATSLLDVQTHVPCIARPPDDTAIHCHTNVVKDGRVQLCIGGIDVNRIQSIVKRILLDCHEPYLSSLPEVYLNIVSDDLVKSVEEMR